MGDIYSIETPESVAVGYEVAGVGSRFLAALIDTAALVAVMIALAIVALVAAGRLHGTGLYVVAALALLAINAVLLGYYIVFELAWNGQSPGKRALRLRVILVTGYPVTPFAVLVRNVVRLVDFLPAFYGIGVTVMVANRRARRLGDLVAGTMVVKEGRAAGLADLTDPAGLENRVAPLPRSAASPASSYTSAWGAEHWLELLSASEARPHLLTAEDEMLVREFLRRRSGLTRQRRIELAWPLAALVQRRIGGPTPLDDYTLEGVEAYLEAVLACRHADRRPV